jgi:hypothetical protein
METLFQLILVLALLKYAVKAGFFKGWRGPVIYSLIAGLIAFIFYPVIIKLESTFFEKVLSNPQQVANLAVLITLEALGGILISIGMVKTLRIVPGILIVGAVFYIELKVFSSITGQPFLRLAILTAFFLAAGIFLLSRGIKKAMPGLEDRYELKFLSNVLLLILAVVLNAGIFGQIPARAPPVALLSQTLAFLGLALAGGFASIILYKKRRK